MRRSLFALLAAEVRLGLCLLPVHSDASEALALTAAELSARASGRTFDPHVADSFEHFSVASKVDGDVHSDTDRGLTLCAEVHQTALQDPIPKSEDPNPQYNGDECLSASEATRPKFLFTHVGHTCGGTVMKTLDDHQQRMEDALAAKHSSHENAFAVVHVHPVRPKVLDGVKYVLVSLRDPVDRLISAYNSIACLLVADFDTCERTHGSLSMAIDSLAARRQLEGFQDELLNCYPNVTAFADGLDEDSRCGSRARDVVHPPTHAHVNKGTCYYLGSELSSLRRKSVYIVHSDSCDADILGIPQWLDLNMTFDAPTESHRSEFPHHDDQPTAAGRERLKRHLAHEYELQRRLEETAVNGRGERR